MPSIMGLVDGIASHGVAHLAGLERRSGLVASMAASTQSPTYHAEGDVWTHTKMVISDALCLAQEVGDLDMQTRRILLATALLHDIAKPMTRTVKENGDIGNPGHSSSGAAMARRIMWRQGVDIAFRETVCSLIAFHQVPFWLVEHPQPIIERKLARMSVGAPNRLLYLQAMADARGRVTTPASERQEIIDNTFLFAELAKEAGCWDGPYPFANSHTRLQYLDGDGTMIPLSAALFDPTGPEFEVTILCGLPGTGKSTWVAANAAGRPVVSMDAIRIETGIPADGNQGRVRQEAKARMKTLLASRTSFIVDGINLDETRRRPIADLIRAYGGRVRMVGLECPENVLRERNRGRRQVVPDAVIDRMIDKWTPPGPHEAHDVELIAEGRPHLLPTLK